LCWRTRCSATRCRRGPERGLCGSRDGLQLSARKRGFALRAGAGAGSGAGGDRGDAGRGAVDGASSGTNGLRAVLKTEVRPYCIILTVESVSGGDIDSLTFLNVPLTLKGAPSDHFSACALSLNLNTRVDALPALQTELRASCEKKFGLVGARVAIVAAPMVRMLPALQETLAGASELPVCRTAGPWAREVPFNHGSYLFNFGSLTETNVNDWIEMAAAWASPRLTITAGAGSSGLAAWS